MKKTTIASAIALTLMCGIANAGECAMESSIPTMPDASSATAEDRIAAIQSIKAYQAELGVYRECLGERMANKELPDAARQAAVDEYNKTVDLETEMVDGWVAFNDAYQGANQDSNS